VKRIKLDTNAITIDSLDGSRLLHDQKQHLANVAKIMVLSGKYVKQPLLSFVGQEF
jgi:hypothetical protein